MKSVFILLFMLLTFITLTVSCSKPPHPQLVSQGADDSSSTLGEYSVKVWGEIRNDGGPGDVVAEITLVQGDKSFTKTSKQFFDAKETKKVELVFDEAEMFGGTPQYQIEAYPFK